MKVQYNPALGYVKEVREVTDIDEMVELVRRQDWMVITAIGRAPVIYIMARFPIEEGEVPDVSN